jgi:hypothetical protein
MPVRVLDIDAKSPTAPHYAPAGLPRNTWPHLRRAPCHQQRVGQGRRWTWVRLTGRQRRCIHHEPGLHAAPPRRRVVTELHIECRNSQTKPCPPAG